MHIGAVPVEVTQVDFAARSAKAEVFKINNDPSKDNEINALFIIYMSFSPY